MAANYRHKRYFRVRGVDGTVRTFLSTAETVAEPTPASFPGASAACNAPDFSIRCEPSHLSFSLPGSRQSSALFSRKGNPEVSSNLDDFVLA